MKTRRILALSTLFLAVILITGCGGSDPPPGDGNHAPTVDLHANMTAGWAPLTVRFTATANDEDGDDLTYVWEYFTGAPSASGEATEQFTYTTAGTYTAKVTVSDGTDEASDTVTITTTAVIGNLVANPGFELDDSSWSYYPGAARINSDAHGDAYCVTFTSDANACAQYIHGGFSPGDTIKISCWVKGANTETAGYLVINFYDGEGDNQGSAEAREYVSGTYGQVLRENIVIPANVVRILVQVGGSAPASTMYADDVYVGP